MPLQLPNLDDRTYTDLVQEGLALIPKEAPEWTNHNPSDPGITLIELYAYLSEMLIYRLNRITDDNIRAFLKLINGPEWEPSDNGLAQDVRDTVRALRQPERAVTCADFERLALQTPGQRVARAHCVPRRNLEAENILTRAVEKPGHISVVIVPVEASTLQPNADLLRAVSDYLEPRRLLATRVHVVGARYVTVGMQLKLVVKPDAVVDNVQRWVSNALYQFFNPMKGGRDGQGWPFGGSVYVSEIYALLDNLPGVDYATPITDTTGQVLDELTTQDSIRLKRNALQKLVAVELEPDELVDINVELGNIKIVSPVTDLCA